MQWQRELETILAEDERSARTRETSAFDEATGPSSASLVLVGGGNLGRKVLRGLRDTGRDVVAFADSNSRLWGTTIEGVPAMSPESAAKKFGTSSAFVVCIWHPDRKQGVQHHIARMKALGAAKTVPFVWLFWKYAETFLPYYLWDLPSNIPSHAKDIREACAALATDRDRATYVSHLAFRSRADFSRQPEPDAPPAYFPADLFELLPDEEFVDCGAFDGDSIQSFLDVSAGKFSRIHAFESDPASFASLQRFIAASSDVAPRTLLHRKAVSSRVGTVRFAATAQENAAISVDGEIEVSCTTLDATLADHRPSFIKMDIEGAEIDALRGARNIVARHKPLLAICIYHRQSDLWHIPLLMRELEPDSSLSLRSYWLDGFDLVCYAVPPHRRKQQLGAVEERTYVKVPG